ncbi:hypothetical protein niasHT_011135 [Heterodera trifolii]|uniref:CCHC-type domain-containing protein n=1 Tax=Heterodera trifolii TaxID=157864 RepID=A0ABD2L9D5_9BILA
MDRNSEPLDEEAANGNENQGDLPSDRQDGERANAAQQTKTKKVVDAQGLGTSQTGVTPAALKNLRSGAIAVRSARDQIERAADTLSARIAEARELMDSDFTRGEALEHAARLMAMERGLGQVTRIFEGHFDKGIAEAGAAPEERQDFLYDFVAAPLPAPTKYLQLREHPTPAELLQIAAEHLGDLQAMRQTFEDEEREQSISRSSRSVDTEDSHPSKDLPRTMPRRSMPEWETSFRDAYARQHDGSLGQQQQMVNQAERVATPVMPNMAALIHRRSNAPSVASVRVNNPVREWMARNQGVRNGPPAQAQQPKQAQHPLHAVQQRLEQLTLNDQRANFPRTAPHFHVRREEPATRDRTRAQGAIPSQPHRPVESAGMLTTFETVRLQPPTFSGRPEDWTTFWAYFQGAVDDKQIPGFEKQLHLLRCLKEGSPARRAVEVYPPSDGNYPVVVQLLKERFGDTNDLQRAIRAQLLHLPPAKDNVSSLTAVIDEFERGVCQLEQLGANVDDESFGPLLEAKLPVRILTDLRIRESTLGAKWTVREFRKAVAAQVKCMRAAEPALAAMKAPERRQEQRSEAERPGRNAPIEEQFHRVFMVRENPPDQREHAAPDPLWEATAPSRSENTQPGSHSRKPKAINRSNNRRMEQLGNSCSLCGKTGHQPSRCHKYSSVQAKRRRLIEQRRCLRCLRPDHTTSHCTIGYKCRKCQRQDHHWLICEEGDKPPAPSRTGTEPEDRTMLVRDIPPGGRHSPSTIHGTASPNGGPNKQLIGWWNETRALTAIGQQHPAHLMTCPIVVASNDGKTECRTTLLLDPASHGDYADASLIKKLGIEKPGSETITIQVFGGKKVKVPSGRHKAKIKRVDGGWESIEVSEVPAICTPIKTEFVKPGVTPEQIQTTTDTVQPQLLLGIRRFWDFVKSFRKGDNGMYLIDTVFGTVICGEHMQTPMGTDPDASAFTIAPCGEADSQKRSGRKAQNLPLLALTILMALLCPTGSWGCQPTPRAPFSEQSGPDMPTAMLPCHIQCTKRGMKTISGQRLEKVEICCPDGCWTTMPTSTAINYELPAEELIRGYTCSGQCWWGSGPPFNVTQRCPAREECELINCAFCWEQLANPTCNPRWASALLGFGAALMLALLGCCCSVISRFWSGATLFSRAIAWGVSYPIKFFNWATGRRLTQPTADRIESKMRKGAKVARAEVRELQRRLQLGRRARAMAQAWQHPDRGYGPRTGAAATTLVLLLLIISNTRATKPISVMVRSEGRLRSAKDLKCAGTATTVLTLLPSELRNGESIPELIALNYQPGHSFTATEMRGEITPAQSTTNGSTKWQTGKNHSLLGTASESRAGPGSVANFLATRVGKWDGTFAEGTKWGKKEPMRDGRASRARESHSRVPQGEGSSSLISQVIRIIRISPTSRAFSSCQAGLRPEECLILPAPFPPKLSSVVFPHFPLMEAGANLPGQAFRPVSRAEQRSARERPPSRQSRTRVIDQGSPDFSLNIIHSLGHGPNGSSNFGNLSELGPRDGRETPAHRPPSRQRRPSFLCHKQYGAVSRGHLRINDTSVDEDQRNQRIVLTAVWCR